MIAVIAGRNWPPLRIVRFGHHACGGAGWACAWDCRGMDCMIESWQFLRRHAKPDRPANGIAIMVGPRGLVQWGFTPVNAPITESGAQLMLDMLEAVKNELDGQEAT